MKTLEIIDFRDHFAFDILDTLGKKLKRKSLNEGFWFITDYEPKDCYKLIKKKEYLFQTHIISDNEYRTFVGANYH
jgi:hypothetical protein